MKFIHRLGYYLGGFSIGLIVLAFFLSGKNASCDYSPNARVIKNISIKPKQFSAEAKSQMNKLKMDSTQLEAVIKVGEVNFGESDTKRDSCNLYVLESYFMEETLELNIKNCDSIAYVDSIKSFVE